MTILPRASSSSTRWGRTSMMRASKWRSLVRMPDWLPVKLMASWPRAWMAMERSAIVTRSPVETSMSSSRRGGAKPAGDDRVAPISRARDRSWSVVLPMALTTTTTSFPARLAWVTLSATWPILVTSATEEPPYFWTRMGMVEDGTLLAAVNMLRGWWPRERPQRLTSPRPRLQGHQPEPASHPNDSPGIIASQREDPPVDLRVRPRHLGHDACLTARGDAREPRALLAVVVEPHEERALLLRPAERRRRLRPRRAGPRGA